MSTELETVDDPTPLFAVVGLSYAVRADLEPADRTLLLLLTFFCGSGNAWTGSVDELAKYMKQSTKQTRAALQRLEAVDAIHVERRAGQASWYSITNPYGTIRYYNSQVNWAKRPSHVSDEVAKRWERVAR
jgi:hypothetical protein